ncbi:PH-domain-containing protein [Backusella circina FSU 941]|nr:PH-domain-containing protein [Backusella circina FSU 941]
MVDLETVYAIHNFEAENDDELSFDIGEPVIVLQKDDGFGDGWWKGQNMNGVIGLFPMNYVSKEEFQRSRYPTPSISGSTKKNMNYYNNNLISETSYPYSTSTTASNQLKRNIVNSLYLPDLKKISPEYWDIDQVSIWLHAMGFISVVENFKCQEITGDVLLELNMNALKELDVPTFGKRFKIQNAINILREEWSSRKSQNRISVASSTLSDIRKRARSTFISSSQLSFATSNSNDLSFYRNETLLNINKPQTVLPMAHHSSINIYSQKNDEDNLAPDMEGWLHKQSYKYKRWNKRWFVLKGPNLFYFKSPKDVRMKGIINLRGYKIIPDEAIYPGYYSFKVQHEEERTFYFYTEQSTSMKSWITSLMKATISRDFNAPVLSSSAVPTVSLDIALRMRPRPPSVLLYKKENLKNSNLPPRSYEATYEVPSQDSGFDSDVNHAVSVQDDRSQLDDDNSDDDDEGVFGVSPSEDNSFNNIQTNSDYIDWVNSICSKKITSLEELDNSDNLMEIIQNLSGHKLPFSDYDFIFEFIEGQGIKINTECFSNGKFYILIEDKFSKLLQAIMEWSTTENNKSSGDGDDIVPKKSN